MAYTDTKVNNMIFNILDKDQYSALRTGGQLDSNQFYFITDDDQALLTVKFNGASSGQGFFTYDGSNPVSINITPTAIGALPITGGTMAGNITFDSYQNGIILQYSNASPSTKLYAIGSDGTTPIVGFSVATRLRNLSTPVLDADATTKKYVDDLIAGAAPAVHSHALLTVKFNGATSGNGFFTYNGSNPVSINITPAAINAVAKGGDTLTGTYIVDRNNGSNSGKIQFKYNDNSSATLSMSGYAGTTSNNTPRLTFTSLKANSSGGSDYNVTIRGIANPTEDNEAANKKYVDTEVANKANVSHAHSLLTIRLNGLEDANHQIVYDGVDPKTVNITPALISAVNKTGDTMTGALTLSGDPTDNLHAATKQYVDNAFSVNDAMQYKGVIHGTLPTPGTYTPAGNAGDTYRVDTEGFVNGQHVEVGDLIICNSDDTNAATSSTYPDIIDKWNIVQVNVDKAVYRSANGFTDGAIIVADGTTGKVKNPTTIGSTTNPIYLAAGVPTALTYTANRLYYSASASSFAAGTHYASSTKIGINSTAVPSGALHVAGATTTTDTITVTKSTTGQPEVIVNNGTYQASLMVNSDGVSHGLYSRIPTSTSKWIIYRGSINGNDGIYIPEWTTGDLTTPIYIDSNGHPQATSHSINSQIDGGVANRMAYYKANNEIDDASHYVSDTQVKIGGTDAPNNGIKFHVEGKSVLNGSVKLASGLHYTSGNSYGLDANNSDFINVDTLYFNNNSNQSTTGGLSFANGTTDKWDTIFAYGGLIRFHPNRSKGSGTTGYVVPHTGNNTGTIGSTSRPVYINAGTITAIDYTIGASIAPGTAQWGAAYYSTTTTISGTAAGATGTALMGKGSAAPEFVAVNPVVTWTNGTTSGPTLKITVLGQNSEAVAIPAANDTTQSGIITTTTQTIGGDKTFHGNVTHNGNVYFANNTIYYVDNYGQAKFLRIGTGGVDPDGLYGLKIGSDASISGTFYFGNNDGLKTHFIDNTAQGYLSRLDVGSQNSNYTLYSGGNTGISGNLDFTNNSSAYDISWIYGLVKQRIHITKDSTADTNVFQFQQITNNGTSDVTTDLFTIKDNGELILTENTGGIYKLYSSNTNMPLIQVTGGGYDYSLLRVSENSLTGTLDDTYNYGFDLRYTGSQGTGENNNKLSLIADNFGGTDNDIVAIDISNSGKVGIGNTFNANFRLFVDGTTRLNDKLRITPTAATTSNESSGLIISSVENGSSGDVALELWRGTNASWQIVNSSGTLIFRNNYIDSRQNTYSQQSITLNYNTGTLNTKNILPQADSATAAYTIGSSSLSYSSIYSGNLTIGGIKNTDAGKAIYSNSTFWIGTTGSNGLIFKTNNTSRARFDENGHFRPNVDNTYDIGSSDYKWKSLWLNASTTGANDTARGLNIGSTHIGSNNEGDLGLYSINNIAIGPGNGTLNAAKYRFTTTTFEPTTDLTYDIGSSTNRFKTAYANCLELQGPSSNPSATAGARIIFSYDNGTSRSQHAYLAYTPNDSYRTGEGLKLWGEENPTWFEIAGAEYLTGNNAHLDIVNDSSNHANDALAYFRNYTSNDWCIKVAKSTYNYGIYIEGTGTDLLRVGTNSRFTVGEGGSKFNGSVVHNGVTYFANGTTYFIDNSAIGYLADLRVANTRLVSNWLGFYTSANAGGNRLGYIQGAAARMYFRIENGQDRFDFNGPLTPSSAGGQNLGQVANEWNILYTRQVALYRNSAWYGNFWIDRVGTANTPATTEGGTDGVAGVTGEVYLRIGNSTAVNTATAYGSSISGANNARGRIRLYGTGAAYTDILPQAPSSQNFWLPNYGGAMYAVHAGNNNAVGSATQPVYVAANGRVTACTAYGSASVATATKVGVAAIYMYPNNSNEINFGGSYTGNTNIYFGYRSMDSRPVPTTYIFGTGNGTATIKAASVYGAVWNDYAEFRIANTQEPGRVIKETPTGEMILTTQRLEKGCEIISDTYGFAIGEDDKAKTPTAAAGRVLAYTDKPRKTFELGMPVCSGPNGTVSQMTEEEARMYPWCIIGTVSEIPTYEEWGTGKVKVNGRIWIRIR